MSDSEDDDVSMSGSEVGEDDVSEENEMATDGEVQGSDADEVDIDVVSDAQSEHRWYQKDIWQQKKLPYYKDLELQANRNYGNIKAGMAHAILLNDPHVGLLHWTLELEKYMDHYGRRLPKEDHILFIKILLTQVKKGEIFRDVKLAMHCLNNLLSKRDQILRPDLVIDWRPLFELYYEVFFKALEEDGIFLMPDGFKQEITNLIFYSRKFFSDDAPQEILDEVRPLMCPFDDAMIRAYRLLELFMPMNFTPEIHAISGAGLWFEEAWHWFVVVENNSLIDTSIMKMFARLSYEVPGYIDWGDKLDHIFTKLLRSLRLGVLMGLCQSFHIESCALLIAYSLGTKCHDKLMQHLRAFYLIVESFLHPSNVGSHTGQILTCIMKISNALLLRVKREHTEKPNKPKIIQMIPEYMKLSQAQIDEIISITLPCMKLAMFSKSSHELVTPLMRNSCCLAPKVVLPAVLDVIYPALETVTEPHRLQQALHVLVAVTPILVKDNVYRIQAITLLNSLLPGLDKNDIAKSMATFQFVGILVNLVALADCSDAVNLRSDLTEEEKELCSATANFENIITMFMDKLLYMLVDAGETANSAGVHGTISARGRANMEDNILHRGTVSVFKGIFRNSSTELYKVAVERVHAFASEHVFDSKIVCDCVADMIFIAIKYNPEVAFPKFLKLVHRRLKECITTESYAEEKPDFQVLWWLAMCARVLRSPAFILLRHWDDVKQLLELIAPFKKCNDATERSIIAVEMLCESICTVYVVDTCRNRKFYDLPSDEYLPIRHWCAPVDKKTWEVEWYVPTQEGIDRVTEVLKAYLVPTLDELANPEKFDKKEILLRLWRIRHCLHGAGASLPMFEGPLIKLTDSPTFHTIENLVCKPFGTPEISIDGRHVRDMILDRLQKLLAYILKNSEDDVKSINEVITILNALESFRGLSKDSFTQTVSNYRVTKVILSNRLAGNKHNIEMLSEDYVIMQHKKRVSSICGYQFRQQNVEIVQMLIRLATSHYAHNRIKSQAVLANVMKEHPYSYKKFLPDILFFLNPENNPTHEQQKGALHILIDGKRLAIVLRASYDSQLDVWGSIISAHHSEKPSIIHLLEQAQNTIVDSYESYRVDYKISMDMKELASQLLEMKEASPANASRDAPTAEEILLNEGNLQKLNDTFTKGYYALADKLLELANSTSLHWKQLDMAQAMLSLLVRRDVAYPAAAVRSAIRLLVHDSIKTRKMATAVLASWLKMNKPKAIKRECVVDKPPAVSSGAKWPIPYGLRDDNRWVVYEEEKLPRTEEEYNNFQFCSKQHWGFYIWPKKLMTYAPVGEQHDIDRQEEDFAETERYMLETMRNPEFSTKMRTMFSIEEKKGSEVFNAVNFSLFRGLARVFNDAVCDVFKTHLDILIPSSRDADQRLAAELVAGLINGAKLWKYKRQQKMWAWLGPLLLRALETVDDDNMRNWGVCLATICGASELRQLQPIVDILEQFITRPIDSAYVASKRLFLVQGFFCQFEWRGMELWNKLVKSMSPMLIQQYANLRDRVAVCLVSATWYDFPNINRSPNLPKALRAPSVDDVVSEYNQYLTACWDETRLCTVDSMDVESEVRKQSRLALKSITSFIYNQAMQAFIALYPSVIRLLPLFCHYNNDVGDEELQKSCGRLLKDVIQAAYITPEHAPVVLEVFEQVLTSQCWWKSKVALLTILRTMVFSNIFVFTPYREAIGVLLIGSLSDAQIEVREAAAIAISTLFKFNFFEVTPAIIDTFVVGAQTAEVRHRHGGVLGLSSIVLAFPYTVPSFLPDVLMKLCRHATQPSPIKDTVKRALSDFKRTHQDSWREHESQFDESQLTVLRDLLVSPNYYV